jgi:RNA polymerase sigma factor (TIGR02999 family)
MEKETDSRTHCPGQGPEEAASGERADSKAAVTRLIEAAKSGDKRASAELLPLVYEELRMLARHQLAQLNPGQTLQATALVHEAYLKLLGSPSACEPQWDSRGHFFAAAARAMRNILIDTIRRKKRLKHGGEYCRRDLTDDVVIELPLPDGVDENQLLALDDALDELERHVGRRAADVVMLRYFVGMSVPQVATALGVTGRTVDRDWRFARAWLHERLGGDQPHDSKPKHSA